MRTQGRAVGLVRRAGRRAAVAAGLAMALVVPAYPGTAPAGAQQSAPGVHVLGWGFSDVSAMAVVGPYLFVANASSGTVTELDARTRDLVRVIDGPAYHFDYPVAMVAVGNHIFVADAGTGAYVYNASVDDRPGAVTELDATTGALVRVIEGSAFRLDEPVALAVWGHDLFVADDGRATSGWLTELDVATGRLVRVMSSPSYHFDGPAALAVSNDLVFAANAAGPGDGSITELSASTGAVVRVVQDATTDGTYYLPSLALDGPYLFAASPDDRSVEQFDVATGRLVRRLPEQFTSPSPLVTAGPYIFIADASVYEVSATTGAKLRTLSSAKYGDDGTGALAVSGGHLYIGGLETLSEVDIRSGALIGSTKGSRYDFEDPGPLLMSGPDLFVVSKSRDHPGKSWVTELDPSTGALVDVMSGAAYGFDKPIALAVSGHYLFVANNGHAFFGPDFTDRGSVTEIDMSTGRLVRTIGAWSSTSGPINDPGALAVIGDHLFVANDGDGSLVEVDIATGAVLRAFSGPQYTTYEPYDMVAVGNDLVLAEIDRTSRNEVITEVNASTGNVVRTFSGASYDLTDSDGGIAVANGKLFSTNARSLLDTIDLATGSVLNRVALPMPHNVNGSAVTVGDGKAFAVGSGSVTEVSVSTGALVERFSGPAYQFDNPSDLVVGGGEVFVANSGNSYTGTNPSAISHTVTEFPA